MSGLEHAAPAIAMLGAFACLIGGLATVRRSETRTKGALMLVMAAVLVANVVIWTL